MMVNDLFSSRAVDQDISLRGIPYTETLLSASNPSITDTKELLRNESDILLFALSRDEACNGKGEIGDCITEEFEEKGGDWLIVNGFVGNDDFLIVELFWNILFDEEESGGPATVGKDVACDLRIEIVERTDFDSLSSCIATGFCGCASDCTARCFL